MRRQLVILIAAAGLAGCGSSGSGSTTTGAHSAAHPVCHGVQVPGPKGAQHLKPPAMALNPADSYIVTVVTNCGVFQIKLGVRGAPKTTASFYSLVKQGLYNNLTFHRVSAGFVIQGGDPLGTGYGGPGYTVVEPPPAGTQYVKGDVAMAKSPDQPAGASGSQFFVVVGANVTKSAHLTPDYALVGKVIAGQAVIDAIASLPTNPPADGSPTPVVVMSNVSVQVTGPGIKTGPPVGPGTLKTGTKARRTVRH